MLPLPLPLKIDRTAASIIAAQDDELNDDEAAGEAVDSIVVVVIIERDRFPLRLFADIAIVE